MRILGSTILLAAVVAGVGWSPAFCAEDPPGWTSIPLRDLGLTDYVHRRWRDTTLVLPYRTRGDRTITAARLRLVLAPPRVERLDRISIRWNGVTIATIAPAEIGKGGGARELPIDARLFAVKNELSFVLEGPTPCVAPGGWALLGTDSVLEVQMRPLRAPADLGALPLPFVDPEVESSAAVPFTFAVPPDAGTLRAAFLVAGYFGTTRVARLGFPVTIGSLPDAAAVVVARRADLQRLGLPAAGPPLRMVERADGPPLLLVTGDSDEELAAAATRLAPRIRASDASSSKGDPGEPLQPGRLVAFSELVPEEALALRGHRDGQIRVPFRLEPGIFFWPRNGIAATLEWDQAISVGGTQSKIVVALNGHYVTTVQRGGGPRSPGARELRFQLPQDFLGARNELVISSEFTDSGGACPKPQPDEHTAVSPDSTLDLRSATEFAILPDLALLAASGYPFAREADLSTTAVVVPLLVTAPTVSALLSVAAHFAKVSGRLATGARFVANGEVGPGFDGELILVGDAAQQPLLERLRRAAPVLLTGDALAGRPRGPLAILSDWGLARQLEAAARSARALDRDLGVVTSFESPLHARRTVLVITATSDRALPDLFTLAASPALSAGSDVALVGGGGVHALRAGDGYGVGRLGTVAQGLWFVSLHAWLLVVLVLAGSAWLARSTLRAVARRAATRLLLVPLLLGLASVARADDGGVPNLEEKASFWESQGRDDKATEVWEQLLMLEPNNDRAKAALARLHQPASTTGDAEQQQVLARPRKLAADGKYADAIAAYRKIFGGAPPDALALEFYETLAGTPEHRAEAVAQLARLAGRSPKAALAHARALTYDEATRRLGIARLAALDGDSDEGKIARAAWRQALLWLGARAADRPLFDAYLARHPDDRAIFAKRAVEPKGAPHGRDLARAYAQLNANALDPAAAAFQKIVDGEPRNVEALVGLSWVRLKQGRFAEARALAERAQAIAPKRPAAWEGALHDAQRWCALSQADDARHRGDFAVAESLLRAAIAVSPRDADLPSFRLADLLLQTDRAAEVEALLADRAVSPRTMLEAGPRLLEALLRQGKIDDANRVEHRLRDDPAIPLGNRRALEVALLRARSHAAAARGDQAQAENLLRDALQLDGTSKSLKLELLYLHLDRLQPEAARTDGESLLKAFPGDPEVIAAAGLAQHEDGDDGAAQKTLSLGDPLRLPAAARALKERIAFQTRVDAVLDRAVGDRATRRRRLDELETAAAQDPELRAIVAAAWSKAGERPRAVALVRKVLASDASRGARLRCAAVLLDAGSPEVGALTRLLDELEAAPRLTARQRRDLAALRTGLLVHQVDADRLEGEHRRGFLRIEPALQRTPDDPQLLAALARLHASAGDPAEARTIYQRLLARDPQSLAFSEGAAEAARAAGDPDAARTLATQALDRHPREPRAFLLAGRISGTSGDDRTAEDFFRRGLELWRTLVTDEKPDVEAEESRALLTQARAQLAADLPTGEDDSVPVGTELEHEIEKLDTRYAPSLHAGAAFRFRSGDAGLASLFEVDIPASFRISPRRFGLLTFTATPIFLTARDTDTTDPAVAERFGTNGVHQPPTLLLPTSNQTWGVGLTLRYDYRGFFVEAGPTPLGFPIVDAVGQLGWAHDFGLWSIAVRGFRAAVTDSVLSFAGLTDPRTGQTWGGVRREGGEVDAQYRAGDFLLRAFVLWAAYTGDHVEDNYGGQYGLTGFWRFLHRANQEMNLGIDFFAMHYARNLRFFTFGQGGYFSPQLFFFAGVPITWERSSQGWRFNLRGELGVNWYREDASPFFPIDTTLQRVRDAEPAAGEVIPGGIFPSVEKISVSGRFHAGVEHDLGKHTILDGFIEGQFAPAFSEVMLALGLRRDFL
jgi:Tfp pilus assembly protein PilF